VVISHEFYMDRAIQLANHGDNRTKTNPKVGAVIVHEGRIIGEGWHSEFGQAHAEINAIRSVQKANKKLLPESTIYVTLEPCSFFGKSPSCALRIVKEDFKKIVVGAIDPNPKVSGGGCKILRDAGLEVVIGIRKNQCEQLLLPFTIQQEKSRPFIHLKWAQSYDGYLSIKGKQTPISHPYLKFVTHRIRGESQGILVGTETLLIDNPGLDNRYGIGDSPVKIILDRKGRIPIKNWAFLLSRGPTLGLGPVDHPLKPYFDKFLEVDSEISITDVLKLVYKEGIGTLMVEGGAHLLKSFIKQDLWDRATVIKSPRSLNEGVKAPHLNGHLLNKTSVIDHDVYEIAPKSLEPIY